MTSKGLLTHQEYQWSHVVFRRPLPIPHEDGVHHHAGFALPPENIPQGLSHKILPCETEENADRIDQLADIGNRIGNGNCSISFDDNVSTFLDQAQAQRRKKLAPIVCEPDMDERERPFDGIVPLQFRCLARS